MSKQHSTAYSRNIQAQHDAIEAIPEAERTGWQVQQLARLKRSISDTAIVRAVAAQPQDDQDREDVVSALQSTVSGIAMAKLRETHESGQDITIPSLGIVIHGKRDDNDEDAMLRNAGSLGGAL